MESNPDNQYSSVNELISMPNLAPTAGVVLEGKTFLLSNILDSDGYEVAVGYVDDHESSGRLKPRLFYRSNSDGGWRVATAVGYGGRFVKGVEGETPEYGQYVQETKLNEHLSALLIMQEERANQQGSLDAISDTAILDGFGLSTVSQERHEDFGRERSITRIEADGLEAYVSGLGFKNARIDRYLLSRVELPTGLEPDFSTEPVRRFLSKHTLAGEIEIEVYAANLNGRPVEWHMAHDGVGRVWVDTIRFKDSGTTSYGTQAEVIIAGALSAKPFDYASQGRTMSEGLDYVSTGNRRYIDVTPTLDRLPVIKGYRQARGVARHSDV